MKFGFLRKKESKNQVLCSACRRDLSEGKSGKTNSFCDQNDPKKSVYFFHSECVSEFDIAEAVSNGTIHEKGWTPQPY
ncbi:MAG: hypothetical protein HY295_01035 [Thaumarchaeota archaeon]|nr:hypothetical protein [Nitrososphaerota archaeon]